VKETAAPAPVHHDTVTHGKPEDAALPQPRILYFGGVTPIPGELDSALRSVTGLLPTSVRKVLSDSGGGLTAVVGDQGVCDNPHLSDLAELQVRGHSDGRKWAVTSGFGGRRNVRACVNLLALFREKRMTFGILHEIGHQLDIHLAEGDSRDSHGAAWQTIWSNWDSLLAEAGLLSRESQNLSDMSMPSAVGDLYRQKAESRECEIDGFDYLGSDYHRDYPEEAWATAFARYIVKLPLPPAVEQYMNEVIDNASSH
jgi:hypothetical protein